MSTYLKYLYVRLSHIIKHYVTLRYVTLADLEPVVSDMLHRHEFRLPVVHLLLKRLHERRAFHRLRLDDVVFQYQLNIVDSRQY